MLKGGNVTVYVSDMDKAVRFYTQTLGLKLRERVGDHWAAIDAGGGLVIGLHPATREFSAGQAGSLALGFEATAPIEDVVKTLESRGVQFARGVVGDKAGKFAFFSDPDGNACYLFQMAAEHV